jgi:hypothetical protein
LPAFKVQQQGKGELAEATMFARVTMFLGVIVVGAQH